MKHVWRDLPVDLHKNARSNAQSRIAAVSALESIRELFRHMEWADALVWAAVKANEAARADADILSRLYHLHAVQHAYLQVWRGERVDVPKQDQIEDLEQWAREYHRGVAAYLDSIDSPALEETVDVPWGSQIEKEWGRYIAATRLQTLQQVAMHSAQYRGQVNLRLRAVGAEPPLIDFIAWVWRGQPPPEWRAG